MLKGIVGRLREMAAAGREQLDLDKFNDPLAKQIPWTPVSPGGCNFQSHRLVEGLGDRLEFQATFGGIAFCMIFALVGAGCVVGALVMAVVNADLFTAETGFLLLFGLVFGSIGAVMFYFLTVPVVFDRARGAYWKGRGDPRVLSMAANSNKYAELKEIHALQIISERCSGSKNSSSYFSYELNLVLKDGRRINVVDHGDIGKLRNDAETLAAFLAVPLWAAA